MKSRHFLAMAFLLSFLIPVTAHAWVTTTVDDVGAVGLYTSIALDSSDRAHISYIDWTDGTLKYATKESGVWDVQTVGSTGSPFEGKYTSIALDNSGNAHISYTDWTNKDLMYATNGSGAWETTPVDTTGDVGLYTSLALDSSGNVHISYYDATNDKLKRATNASGSWMNETVPSPGQTGMFTSIAVDGSDKAHISYWGPGGLMHATNGSGAWGVTVVDPDPDVGLFTSIVLDSSGNAHISYYDNANGDLKYATNALGSWATGVVDSDGDVGWDTSIALDISGNVHISYYDATNDKLKHATNATGDWATEIVDSDGEYTSIALDSSDNIHISYSGLHFNKTSLKYANTACIDNDGDNYGAPGDPACPDGPETDCDDENDNVNPGENEACDGLDNDCDGLVPLEEVDEDLDTFMVCANDCDDDPEDDPSICEACTCGETECGPCARCIHPGQEQGYGDPVCSDTVDNDCDTFVDSEDPGCCECIDNDRDGYGLPGCPDCAHPQTDCDDTDPNVYPGAIEECGGRTCEDGIDNDCDNKIDDADPDCKTWCLELGASTLGKTDDVNYLSLLAPFALILVLKRRRRRA